MKIAIVNDTLEEFGGAERVALAMYAAFPDATFFTSFADPEILRQFFPMFTSDNCKTLRIPHIVAPHRSLQQMLSPVLWKLFDVRAYDVVITNPSHLMCNLIRPPAVHIQYIHTIPKNIFGLIPPSPLQTMTGYDRPIRPLYTRAIRSTPYILTSSGHMQHKIREAFGVRPDILEPPVRVPRKIPARKPGEYYLMVTRLDREKHIEIAIQACNALRAPLLIAGKTNEEAYERYLRSIAGPTVRFLGFISDDEVESLYIRAHAFLFPSKCEDFGIAPLEASAHGVPVVAYRGGGAKETVKDGVTGVFFRTHTPRSMARAIIACKKLRLSTDAMTAHARAYSEDVFAKKLRSYVSRAQRSANSYRAGSTSVMRPSTYAPGKYSGIR